jgi:glycosyltransferase involved in cell wall biosynthesis
MPAVSASLRVAILLSTDCFEDFYGTGLGLSREEYVAAYRNDWSWDWCRNLRRSGVSCAIFVPTIARGARVHTAEGVDVEFLALGRAWSPWRRAPVLARTPVGRYLSQGFNAAAFIRPLRRALAEHAVDVLCVQEYWTARFDLLASVIDVPVVAVDQGIPARREIKLGKRRAFERAAGVIVQTESEAGKVARYGGDPARIPNAVDASFYSPAPSRGTDRELRILTVGRLHDAHKRISFVIRALAQLEPEWTLQIAGRGPDQARLEALATSLGVRDRVSFLGFVAEPSELRELYRRACVFVLPSAWEGLPMVLLEAMSCGTAVVGSTIPAISEVIHDGIDGLLVSGTDVEQIAVSIRSAGAERDRLGAAARIAILGTYDQTVVGPQLASFLSEAAHRAGPS